MNKQYKSPASRGIEWTDYTWNPVGGCQHGCRWTMPNGETAICYAELVATRVAQKAYPHGFDHHYWRPDALTDPLGLKAGSKVFMDSMSDLMGHWVPEDEIKQVFDVCRQTPDITYQMLTKNAPRIEKFDFPPNVWVGVSSPPDQMMGKALDDRRRWNYMSRAAEALRNCNATIKWMSIEPLSFNIAPMLTQYEPPIQWAVIGAASSGSRVFQPHPNLVRDAIVALRGLEAAVFFKGNLRGSPAAEPWLEEFPMVAVEA